LPSTGRGKALLLDDDPRHWRKLFDEDHAAGSPTADYAVWEQRMRDYVAVGRAFDLEENEDLIRCVSAPIRGVSGQIVAAISVSSAAQYMADDRMQALSDDVRATAMAVSRDLGWSEGAVRRAPPRSRR
jgi:DNA-binding IclR family transcriptional regulator